MLIENEKHESLRDALIRLCVELIPLDGPPAVNRTDPAPGCQALVADKLLAKQGIVLVLGRVKNTNKNPVAEKAVRELEEELLRHDPYEGQYLCVCIYRYLNFMLEHLSSKHLFIILFNYMYLLTYKSVICFIVIFIIML